MSVLTEYEKDIKPKTIERVVGLDFAMDGLYVESELGEANYPKFYRQSLDKLAKEMRILSRKKKGSGRFEKQRLKKLQEKTANQRKNFLHHQSKKLASNYDAVITEDLNMKAMAGALHFGKSVHDNGWGMFTDLLAYKLRDQGKRLVKMDKWIPSTKNVLVVAFCHCQSESINASVVIWQTEIIMQPSISKKEGCAY